MRARRLWVPARHHKARRVCIDKTLMGALLVDISINAPITKVFPFPYEFLTDSSALALRSEPLLAEQPPREDQRDHALPGIRLVPRAGNESLRERVPDRQKWREPPLERRFGADVVSRLNPPSQF